MRNCSATMKANRDSTSDAAPCALQRTLLSRRLGPRRMSRVARRIGCFWLVATSTVMMSSSAIAEVCDKERPLWTPSDGPVGPLDTFLPLATSLSGIALAGFLIAAVSLGWRLAYALSAGIAISMILQTSTQWFDVGGLDPIRASAIREGCMYPPWLNLFLLVAVVLLSIWQFRRLARSGTSGSTD